MHGMGLIGHLQDIAVAKNQHGKNLGFRMLTALDDLAKTIGCYKVRSRLLSTFFQGYLDACG